MSPVYRTKSNTAAEIAEISREKSPRELIARRRGELKESLRQLAREQKEQVEALKLENKNKILADLEERKQRVSPAASQKAERARKLNIKAARDKAEYDIYKEIMISLATRPGPTLQEAHERADAFADHIIKRSPPGHADVGYEGQL